MVHKVYVVLDKVSGSVLSLSMAPTDGAFMRDTISGLLRFRPLDELEYRQVAEFDLESFAITPVSQRICKNDAYKMPETDTKKLSKEDIIALANQLQAVEPAESK